jgi:peptide/nickel transport system substrate-binding protein
VSEQLNRKETSQMNSLARWIPVLLVLGLLVVGCAVPATPVAPVVVTEAPPAVVATEVPPIPEPVVPAKILRVAQGTDAVTLDAHRITDSPTATVAEHIIEPLFKLSHIDGSIQPNLAVDAELSEDGLLWTIKLREGVTFHDGTPFNSEAVKANLERILDPEQAITFRFLVARITDIETPDEHTVVLHTATPFAPMLAHLTHSSIGMISPKALAEMSDEELADHPVGTGPFTLTEWVKGEKIVLTKNPNYWGEPPTVDGIEFMAVREDGARMVLVESGAADVAVRVPAEDVPRLEALPGVKIDRTVSVRTIYIGFNVLKEPFHDVRVRQALNHAVDKDAIVDFILGGQARVSDAPIAPNIFGYTSVGPYEYDPDQARKLLAEAGYPDGFKTTFVHPTGRYVQDARIADAVRSQLAEVGVQADLNTMEWAQYLAFTRQPPEETQVEIYMLGWGTVTGDADYGLWALFHTSEWVPAGSNRSFYSNPEVDALLEAGRSVADPNERLSIYAGAMQLIWEDAPWLFLHSESQISAIREGVEGVIIHPTERVIGTYARLP